MRGNRLRGKAGSETEEREEEEFHKKRFSVTGSAASAARFSDVQVKVCLRNKDAQI